MTPAEKAVEDQARRMVKALRSMSRFSFGDAVHDLGALQDLDKERAQEDLLEYTAGAADLATLGEPPAVVRVAISDPGEKRWYVVDAIPEDHMVIDGTAAIRYHTCPWEAGRLLASHLAHRGFSGWASWEAIKHALPGTYLLAPDTKWGDL